MKKALFAVAAVALLAGSVHAGEYKTHSWPCSYDKIHLCTIPVKMEVGYWVAVTNQDASITLSQTSIHVYHGCTTLKVSCNVTVNLSATITKTGDVPGDYSCTLNPTQVPAMEKDFEVELCADVANADLSGVAGGTTATVSNIAIYVVPAA
jgi:hypothetical protein